MINFKNIDKESIKSTSFVLTLLTIVLGLVIVFSSTAALTKATGTICLAVLLVMAFLVIVLRHIQMELYQFVFIFLMFTGGLSLLIQPIFNIPDEPNHYAHAELISRGKIFLDYNENTHQSINAVGDLMDDMKVPYTKSQIKEKKIDQTTMDLQHVSSTNLFFVYIPQTIGIILAKLLGLDLIWSLWLGRFLNLICYSLLVSLAIKITERLQFIMFFVAALPMSIQQAASLSSDAIVNGSVFLLIGFFTHLYFKEDSPITWKEIATFFLIAVIATLSKVTNIFWGGLILTLPLKEDKGKKKTFFVKILFIILLIIIGGSYYLYSTKFPIPDVHKVYLDSVGADSTKQIQYIMSHFLKWIHDFGSNLIDNSSGYINMLNDFGWLEYKYSVLNLLTVFMFGKICFQERGIHFNCLNKILISLMVLGNYAFICLALYLSWTPVGKNGIDGVQGRYFIPLLLVLTLLFNSGDKGEGKRNYFYDVLIMTIMIGMMLIVTTLKYY